MSDSAKRRMFRRLGVVLIGLGLFGLAGTLGLTNDGADANVIGVVFCLLMVGGGAWSIVASQRVGR